MTGQVAETNVDQTSTGNQLSSLPITQLRIGATLRRPIYDDRSVLLLSAGTTLSISLVTRLRRRGIESVQVRDSELANISKTDASTPPDGDESLTATGHVPQGAMRGGGSHWDITGESYVHNVRQRGAQPYTDEQKAQFAAIFQKAAAQIECLFESLAHRDRISGEVVLTVSHDALTRMVEDLDLFVALGIQPQTDGYPSKHAMQTAMLALAIGTNLGLPYQRLVELGVGCLIHDVGMLNINHDVVNANHRLDDIEFLEITKHPTLTFDLIRDLTDVPNGSRMVAYQMHERQNGSGYPRRRRGSQIHPLARIAAVADVFVAMVSPRPHRPALHPYAAMEQILHGTHTGLYDPSVVRALLHTVSLFPLGSYVQLNDGQVGKVLRTNGVEYMRPIIELWSSPTSAPSQILDLGQHPHLQIDRPLPDIIYQPGPRANPSH
jgi:HD-GYP domain-containing protein (c-di-GMP phosphodiesterase class II)